MLTMLSLTPCKFAYMHSTIETTGDRIRRCRKKAALTQQQLADTAGVSAAAVAQWESGDSKTLRPENLFKVARALKKCPEWLVTGAGPEQPRWEIYDAIADLPGNAPQQVLDFIQYRFDKAQGLIASDKLARYNAMIEDFKRDLDKRKKRAG